MTSETVKKTKKKKIKLNSLKEFQLWLNAFCTAHDDDWVPSLEQWVMIRELIDGLPSDPIPVHASNDDRRIVHHNPQPTFVSGLHNPPMNHMPNAFSPNSGLIPAPHDAPVLAPEKLAGGVNPQTGEYKSTFSD